MSFKGSFVLYSFCQKNNTRRTHEAPRNHIMVNGHPARGFISVF
jgi:hypothetical protein